MDLQTLIAHWSGQVPPGFVPHAALGKPETCVQPRCNKPRALKANGQLAKSCSGCLARRARSCKRRRAALTAEGGCRRCAYRKRLEGDFLCQRCRDDRDAERAQKRQDAIDAAAVDEFAAKPDRAHEPSNLDCGVSPWNARAPREPSAAYWSPLPDPVPKAERGWEASIHDDGRRFHRY
ncbi:MAG: hypothetical protein OXG71_00210 [Rhodospirillales bacterium]|nr:hypothetical protein [Rhodospirillales bacterium]